jgi:gas vesicle protein
VKKNLLDFVKTIDELDEAISLISSKCETDKQNSEKLLHTVSEKSKKVRKHVAELDARIEKTISEWERLKKSEIGLSLLETEIRKNINQE